ncbi:MAG TPA: hypothetical protein VGM51_03080 [Armatimonadota bacterium]|jgi:hypothetical protein
MPIVFRCPACGRDLEAPDAAFGVAGSCRFCGAQIVSPSEPDGPATLVAAGPASMQAAPGDVSQPTGEIDPGGILSEAWALLKVHWAIILAAYLIVGLITVAAMAPWFVPFFRETMRHPPAPGTPTVMPVSTTLGIMVLSILFAPLLAGPLYLVDRIIARGDDSMGAIFAGLRHYGPLVQFAVVYNLPLYALQIAQSAAATRAPRLYTPFMIAYWLVMIFMIVTLMAGQMEVIDRGVDGISALKASWEFTKGHRLMILVTGLLLTLCYLAGLFACCIGALFTMGFIPLGQVLVYRHLRGLQGTPD